ncbi:MAG: alpha/beta hydrolase [Actinobacteria bacterium]|nr:alpha/beta hydrolase [Actinomycetota bacterium]
MTWLLLVVGLFTLALGVNVLFPTRTLVGLVVGFMAEWLVAELAHWTLLVLGAAVVVLVAAGGADQWPGLIGLVAAIVGAVLIVVEMVLAARSGPIVAQALAEAGLDPPERDRGRTRRLLLPFWLSDRRVARVASNVRYAEGDGRRHLLDVYRPRGGCIGAPVLLQIHGGGWIIGSKRQQGRPLMNRMAADGWVCVAINYRLAPRDKFPAQLVDVKLALAWIREHIAEYGGDPSRVIVTGGSAGGHLAALAALTMDDPRYQPGFESADTSVLASVPLYPPTDLVPLLTFRGRQANRWAARTAAIVFGESPAVDPARFRDWSPIALVTPGLVPFFVIQGAADNLVPVAQTRAFVDALRALPGQRVVYLELPGAPHAFEVFHSVRSEAAIGAIRQFCDGVVAGVAVSDADSRDDAQGLDDSPDEEVSDPSDATATAATD